MEQEMFIREGKLDLGTIPQPLYAYALLLPLSALPESSVLLSLSLLHFLSSGQKNLSWSQSVHCLFALL